MPRPSSAHQRLTAVVRHDDAGRPVTVAQSILDWLRLGLPYDTSIIRADVPTATMRYWLAQGTRLEQRVELNPDLELDEEDDYLLTFSRQVAQAVAEGQAAHYTGMVRLARGGATKTVVTSKVVRTPRVETDADGVERTVFDEVEVERSTRTESTLPSFAAQKWILENRYGMRAATHVVVDQKDPLGEGERADLLVDTIELWLADRERQGAGPSGE